MESRIRNQPACRQGRESRKKENFFQISNFKFQIFKHVSLHLFLFAFLILLLPSQLGKHFWLDFSLVRGIRIDYLSPTVYLTDILVLGILSSWFLASLKLKTQSVKLLLLLIFIIVNIFFSSTPLLTLYKWLKFVEFALLAFYVSQNSGLLLARRSLLAKAGVIGLFSIPLLYSSVLAWMQFISQHSIGGLWWLLGERTFTRFTPGIAQIAVGGQLILRPYATFSHPNQLAGYVLITVTLLIGLTIEKRSSILLRYGMFLIGLSTLLITFSRGAMVAGFCALLVVMIASRKKKKKAIVSPSLIFLITIFVGLAGAWAIGILPYQDESIGQRLLLNGAALRMIFSSPIVGVGLGNFIPRLSEFIQTTTTASILQPVHNIYLLITAETGLVGLAIFLWLIQSSIFYLLSSKHTVYHLALLEILLIGLFDHYFITLQQTQLLFAIVVGMVWSKQSFIS